MILLLANHEPKDLRLCRSTVRKGYAFPASSFFSVEAKPLLPAFGGAASLTHEEAI